MEKEIGFVGTAGTAEAYNLTEAAVAAAVASGAIKLVTHKKGGNPLDLKVTDEDRGVKGAKTPWNSLEALTLAGAALIVSGGDVVGPVPEGAVDGPVLAAVTYAADLYARARARGIYLDKYGVKDESATIARALKTFKDMGMDDVEAKAAYEELKERQRIKAAKAAAADIAEAAAEQASESA